MPGESKEAGRIEAFSDVVFDIVFMILMPEIKLRKLETVEPGKALPAGDLLGDPERESG